MSVAITLEIAFIEGLLANAVQILVQNAEQGAHKLLGILLFVASEMSVLGTHQIAELTWSHVWQIALPELSQKHRK